MSQNTCVSEKPSLPIRACIFDVDGLLIDSEDIYTCIFNDILKEYGKPPLPWTIKALQQSRGYIGQKRLLTWADNPISVPEFEEEVLMHHERFRDCRPLPGVLALLSELSYLSTESLPCSPISLAIASSTTKPFFATKMSRLPSLTSFFSDRSCVFGDDSDVLHKKEKPAPDVFLLALERINSSLLVRCRDPYVKPPSEIRPEECLVFEDSIAGVAAGRAAGMRVCWVPHEGLRRVCKGIEHVVLGGRLEEAEDVLLKLEQTTRIAEEQRMQDGRTSFGKGEHHKGEIFVKEQEIQADNERVERILSEDGWAEMLDSLEHFDYKRYGIVLKGAASSQMDG